MAVASRPLTLGEILDRTVQLYRRHFLLLAGIAAPAAAMIVLVSGSLVLFFSSKFLTLANAQQTGKPLAPPDVSQLSLLMVFAFLLFLLVGAPILLGTFGMALAALSRASWEILNGRAITIRASYGYAFRHFWRHVGILFQQWLFAGIIPYFAFAAIVVVGAIIAALASKAGSGAILGPLMAIAFILLAIAVLVLCVFIWLRLSLAYPVSVAEDTKAWPSLKRSNSLSKGTCGRIFVMFLLVAILSIVVTFMLTMPVDIVIGLFMKKTITGQGPQTVFLMLLQIVNLAIGFLMRMLVMPIYTIALIFFYNDQRTRIEGYDIEQLMEQAGWFELPSAMPPAAPASAAGVEFPTPPQPSFRDSNPDPAHPEAAGI
jgi:hypothetical protein